jgi:hypothetical protein
VIHTREEAIARAKAWLDKESFGECFEEVYPGGLCPDKTVPGGDWKADILYQRPNSACVGGYVVIANHGGDDDQGCVVAIDNYSGDTKKFKWRT